MQTPVPIIAFSGMRWDSLPAPSKRVLSQLAKTRSVFFLERPESVEVGDPEFWELKCGAPDLLVCRPRIANLRSVQPATSTRMARALLGWLDIDEFVAWIYSRSEFAWAGSLSPSLVIHDRSLEADASARDGLPDVYAPGSRRGRMSMAPFEASAMGLRPS